MNFLAVLFAVTTLTVPPFGKVNVLDEVDCTKTDHDFVEMPAGVSKVETILGRPCRHVPVQAGEEASMISYRLGKGKNLKPNGSYVIVMDYPDDLPRNYVIVNRATDSHRAFSTGTCFGDAWAPAYIDNHLELVAIPQSGAWEDWTEYTSLQDWTCDYCEGEVEKDKPIRHLPADGFDFVIAQYSRNHDPISHGIAVSRIRLCEIPNEKACYAKINLPPAPLPERHLFWREEMSDGPAIQGGKAKRRCADQLDWMRHKCRQMKMLGMNTLTKDLLEFGHVQHWNPDVVRPGWAWGADAESNSLWERTVDMATREFGFSILPYYEWCGNLGADFEGKKSYGYQKLCEPLNGEKSYTHIWWTESANLDLTDPVALVETKRLLDATIVRFKDRARFLGAFFRTRPSQWPISFSEATRVRFGKEANGGTTPSRDALKQDKKLYDRYVAWWHGKRAVFMSALAGHLRTQGIKDAWVYLDGESSESGPGLSGGGMVAENPSDVAALVKASGVKAPGRVVSLADTVKDHLYLKGRREPGTTWGKWEWQHACPADLPGEYVKAAGTALAMPVNRLYSARDNDAFTAYSDARGMQTVIRHHSLNEHNVKTTVDGKQINPIGYDMNDTVKAGRASMMIEVEAMAHGDPANFGYLIGSCFARGFPGPAREFNLNFLALPALPSTVVPNACSDPDITLREIDCTKFGKGRYYALVHTGRTAKRNVSVKLPHGARAVTFAADGTTHALKQNTLTLPTLQPWQLLALRAE